MTTLFEVLVLPNIAVTDQDLDEYECEPQLYIKSDLEESDAETRRRHCMKFVAKLSGYFEQEVAALLAQLIQRLQQEYASDREAHWRQMATVVNLIITAGITCYTYQHGATEVRLSGDLLRSYITGLIVPELQPGSSSIDN